MTRQGVTMVDKKTVGAERRGAKSSRKSAPEAKPAKSRMESWLTHYLLAVLYPMVEGNFDHPFFS